MLQQCKRVWAEWSGMGVHGCNEEVEGDSEDGSE